MRSTLVGIFILLSIFSFSQEKEDEVFDWLPKQETVKRHAIGINVPLYYNPNGQRNINLYYELLTFEGGVGFQFPIKYISDETLDFRGIFTGCDFVHHTTNHNSKIQFLYGGGVNPGFFIWEPIAPGPYKRQNSVAVYIDIKAELYYLITKSIGVGIFYENAWIARMDGYKQASPIDFKRGGTQNVGLKAVYRF